MIKSIFPLLISLVMASCGSLKNAKTSETQDGSSYGTAVKIQETQELAGIAAEYTWIKDHYPGYTNLGQSLVNYKSKPFDIIRIKTAKGIEKSVYFDISNSYGKY